MGGVATVFHLLSRVTEGGWLSLASAAVLALPLAALATAPRLTGLEVERLPGPRAAAGEQAQTTVRVTNRGRRASSAHILVDQLPGHESRRLAVPALRSGGRVEVTVRRAALRRTSHAAGDVTLTATTPFGLFQVRRVLAVAGRVVVHPARVPAPTWGRRAGPVGSARGQARPIAGRGSEVLGLRPWQPGDPAHAVSARATARHGRPVVLEREPDEASAVVVLVAAGGTAGWEAAVAGAAAIAARGAGTGGRLVVIGLDLLSHPTVPQVLDAFAAADTAPPLSAAGAQAAARAARTAAVVVLVAEPTDPLRAQALAVLHSSGCPVVVPDAA